MQKNRMHDPTPEEIRALAEEREREAYGDRRPPHLRSRDEQERMEEEEGEEFDADEPRITDFPRIVLPEEEQEQYRPSRLVPILVSLVAFLGFAGVVWYAYSWGIGGGGDGDLPVIKSEQAAEKEKPADPGGLSVPYQNSELLNQGTGVPTVESSQAEQLLPAPEEPQPLQPAQSAESILPPASEETPSTAPAGVAAGQGSGEAVPAPESQAAESGVKAPDPALEPKVIAPPPAAAEPAPALQSAAKSSGEAAPASAPAVGAPAPSATGGEFWIQLASVKGEADAKKAWTVLQSKNKDLLGALNLNVERADLGDRGIFYRVQAGSFQDRDSAAALCGQLKTRNQDCLVVKR